MPRGRPPKYPWANWLDGERHVLNSREDFPGVDVHSIRQQALNEAARRGVEITTSVAVNPQDLGVDYLLVARPPAPKPKRIDWDQVFAKLPRTLVYGEDFTCSVDVMRVRVYQAAQRRGPLPVHIARDGMAVVVSSASEEAHDDAA